MNQGINATCAKPAHFRPINQNSPESFSGKDIKQNQIDDFSRLVDLIAAKLATIKNESAKADEKAAVFHKERFPKKHFSNSLQENCVDSHRYIKEVQGKLHTSTAQASECPNKSTPLAGDFDRDGDVDLDDLNIYRNSEGTTGRNLVADANRDGIIDEQDRQILLNNFGRKL